MFLASVQLGRVTDPDRAEFYAKLSLPHTFEKVSRVYRSRRATETPFVGSDLRGRESPCVCSRSMLQLQLCPPFRGTYSGITFVSLLRELRLASIKTRNKPHRSRCQHFSAQDVAECLTSFFMSDSLMNLESFFSGKILRKVAICCDFFRFKFLNC